MIVWCLLFVFCCKQKTAYEMLISDWSADVCSSDLATASYKSKAVTVLLNRGRASFLETRTFPAGPRPGAIVNGDFDRDGDADLTVAPSSTSRAQLGRASGRESGCQYVYV